MIEDDAVIQRLEDAIGRDHLRTGEATRPYGTNGFAPFVVAIPEDRTQAAEVIRAAADSRVGVLPRGGGTKLGWEPAPSGMVIVLSTERMNRIVHHEPRDLTLTTEPGVVLDRLNGLLRSHNQRLSVDPPHAARATIGGVCATNDSGPLRCRYGTLRDLVVGMEVVEASGALVRSGGRVVKNAAGYGLHRLHVGAFGSLGLITEMTFRLHPLPEAFRLAVVRCRDGEHAERCLAGILSGRTQPAMIELVRPLGDDRLAETLRADDWILVPGYEDCREAVDWQCEHLVKTLDAPVHVLDERASETLHDEISEWPGKPAAVAFKATMKSSHVAAFLAWAGERGFALLSHAANGIVYGRSSDLRSVEAAEDLAAAAEDGGGQILWRSLPADAKVDRWAPSRSDLPVMRRIKHAFDPIGIFSPGRWVDGM